MKGRKAPQFEIVPVLRYLGIEVPPLRGDYTKVICKWHNDTSPSASVSRYGYRCFGCDKTGDAIALVREEFDLSYADSVAKCQEIVGGEGDGLPQQSVWGESLLG